MLIGTLPGPLLHVCQIATLLPQRVIARLLPLCTWQLVRVHSTNRMHDASNMAPRLVALMQAGLELSWAIASVYRSADTLPTPAALDRGSGCCMRCPRSLANQQGPHVCKDAIC